MFHVGVLLHFNIIHLFLEISVLKQPGGDLSFGIEMTSCNHENPTNFHAGCVQDFARVEGWILSFEIGNYKGKKHGCEHSQKGVGRKKTSDLIENQQKMGSYTP